MGLTVEPCVMIDEPLRAEDFISAVRGVTIMLDGSILVNLNDQPTIRLVDSPAPGCDLTRDPEPYFDKEWGTIQALEDGTVYVMEFSTGGPLDFEWKGGKEGACFSIPGGGQHIGIGTDGLAMSELKFGDSPQRFDFNTCTSEEAVGLPKIRGAARVDLDFVVATSNRIRRYTPDLEFVWESVDNHALGNRVVRCGDDVCVQEGGSARFSRFAGEDGLTVTRYSTASLFGIGSGISNLGESADHTEIIAAFEATHPDPECSAGDMRNIFLYRISGF